MTSKMYDTATHQELGLMVGFPPPPDKRVSAENGIWDPPNNRWAYQNMRRIVPTAGFAHSTSPVELPRELDDGIAALPIARTDGSTASFTTFLDETFTDSLVVLKGGVVVAEHYLNGMTPTQPHQMMSCTKSFIGLVTLTAVHDGLLGENDLVGGLLSEVDNGGAFSDATVGQVLDMTSSMYFNEDYDDPQAHIRDYARIIFGGAEAGLDPSTGSLYEYLPTLAKDSQLPHGETFVYQTPKTDVVNWVNNRLTGRSLVDDFAALWQALGTDSEAYLLLDPAGTPVAGAGLNASPSDLARFATMVVNDGLFDGNQVIPKAVLDKISVGGSTEAFMNGREATGRLADGHWSYRGQWWVRGTPGREAITALGINGQWIYCDRTRDVAIVKQSSQPEAVAEYFDDYTLNAIDTIVDHLT